MHERERELVIRGNLHPCTFQTKNVALSSQSVGIQTENCIGGGVCCFR